ncbi:uncharacterized protein LOC115960948 [Quercus lobata]|uniref:uncharacterized protein LOC115960948 n=1 Tax=Quercus lobata TaxID=97700 RepID=UPI001248C876|nr:uncharacterized protein LOC115960948 [Quercus lobata]
MEASCSTNSSVRRAPMKCYCNQKPVLVVAWTEDNPGKRALSVFQVGRKCRFFQWHDDEICERGKVLIPQQRQRIIKLEAELANCKKREKFLVVVVALLVVIFAVLCLLR